MEYATVIATEDKIEQIDRIAAVIDPEEVSSKARHLTVELTALDKKGDEVLNVFINPETVSFRAAAGFKKSVNLDVPVKDESEDSYERTYTAPKTVLVKGVKEVIDVVGTVKAKETDISYIYEDTEIPIEYDLPEGVYLADRQGEQTLKVTVREKKEEEE